MQRLEVGEGDRSLGCVLCDLFQPKEPVLLGHFEGVGNGTGFSGP